MIQIYIEYLKNIKTFVNKNENFKQHFFFFAKVFIIDLLMSY